VFDDLFRIVEKEARKIYIVMEYCEGGDMAQLIKKCKKDKDWDNKRG
jgi:NIMA (never in mitosis gene a)-related kinase